MDRKLYRFRAAVLCGALAAACCAPAWAQETGAADSGATNNGAAVDNAADASTPSLPTVTVTGSPIGGTPGVTPAATLSGDNLLLQRANTLGDTLQDMPGVSSSYFGPNAGRPMLRGLDGDRVQILQNGGASVDASALSYDHNPPIDPLAIDSVQLLRGPDALLYGGNPQAGVVNVIDSRIPHEPVAGPEGGVTGQVDGSWSSGAKESNGAALVEGGNDRYALHVDGFDRNAGDTSVPITLSCSKPGSAPEARAICNSASHTYGGSVGGTLFFDRGYLGASVSGYDSNYGTVAEDDVNIGMHSVRTALEGLWRNPGGLIESVHGLYTYGDYHHTEYDSGEADTTFSNVGDELRLEAQHHSWGNLTGQWGLQWDNTEFSALGDDAFAPPSHTGSLALFADEALATSWGKFTFAGRGEQVNVHTPGSDEGVGFAADERRFTPGSAAVGAQVNLPAGWQLLGNLARTERAPKDFELFANGPHDATGTWEIGNAALGVERSTGAELGAQWQGGPQRFAVTGYASHYDNYIGLLPTGATEGDNLPVYAYTGVKARFVGAEASGTVRLLGDGNVGGWKPSASALDLDLRADMVRATNLSVDQPLPLIPPARLGATLRWSYGPWGARVGLDHAMAQNRVPAGDRVTAGYSLWNAALTWRQKAGPDVQLEWYIRADNITNQLAYSATSILTQTVPGRAPLPGRSVCLGVRAMF